MSKNLDLVKERCFMNIPGELVEHDKNHRDVYITNWKPEDIVLELQMCGFTDEGCYIGSCPDNPTYDFLAQLFPGMSIILFIQKNGEIEIDYIKIGK